MPETPTAKVKKPRKSRSKSQSLIDQVKALSLQDLIAHKQPVDAEALRREQELEANLKMLKEGL